MSGLGAAGFNPRASGDFEVTGADEKGAGPAAAPAGGAPREAQVVRGSAPHRIMPGVLDAEPLAVLKSLGGEKGFTSLLSTRGHREAVDRNWIGRDQPFDAALLAYEQAPADRKPSVGALMEGVRTSYGRFNGPDADSLDKRAHALYLENAEYTLALHVFAARASQRGGTPAARAAGAAVEKLFARSVLDWKVTDKERDKAAETLRALSPDELFFALDRLSQTNVGKGTAASFLFADYEVAGKAKQKYLPIFAEKAKALGLPSRDVDCLARYVEENFPHIHRTGNYELPPAAAGPSPAAGAAASPPPGTQMKANYTVEAGILARAIAGSTNIVDWIEAQAAKDDVKVSVNKIGGRFDIEYTGDAESVERFHGHLRGTFEKNSYEATFGNG